MSRYTFDDIKPILPDSFLVSGKLSAFFTNAKTTLEADEESIVFIDKKRKDKLDLYKNTKAGVIVCDEKLFQEAKNNMTKLIIGVGNPKLIYAKIVNRYFVRNYEPVIHPLSVIHPEAIIGTNVYIGPFTTVGKSVIGDNSRIMGHVYIYDNVTIGKNVVIQAGSVVGSEGFGYVKDGENLINFPHIGSVVLEDNVEIGANNCIDRGALGVTLIKTGAKTDNLVHIAHNVVIGKNTMITANSMIAGSTVVGDNTYLAPSSSLCDAISIGNRVTIGLGASVMDSINDDETWITKPASSLLKTVKREKIIDKIISAFEDK